MKKISQIDRYQIGYLLYVGIVFLLFFIALLPQMPSFFIFVPLVAALSSIALRALEKIRKKKIGTEFFLIIATIISVVGHQEHAMIVVLLIMLIAQYLERVIDARTTREIESLINLIPNNVLVKIGDNEQIISINNVKPDMEVIVSTGGRIPVDGIIIKGQAEINEAALTGESTLQNKSISDKVYAGTFIEGGFIIIKTEKVGHETFFGKITKLIKESEEQKAHITILADKIASYLVPLLLFFIFLVWFLTKNLNLIITLLVFGSPLELTLITPLTILASTIAAFRNGILIKGGYALEKFSQIDTLVFDKTGTLTQANPSVVDVQVLNDAFTVNDLIKIAAIAEKRSGHALAKALLRKAKESNINVPDADKLIAVSGHGNEILYDNKHCFFGNRHFIEAPEHANITIPDSLNSDIQELYSSNYLACDGKLIGKISVADIVRDNAKQTIDDLKKDIKNIVIISGDRQKVVSDVAQALGISQAYGDIFPDQKLTMIQEFQKKGHLVAMVGDGINDAPALKQANVGIAMGAMGMEPAIDAADIVLTTNDLEKIYFIHQLSKKTFEIIKQNIIIGFILIHTIGILLAFWGFLNPIKAALFHAIPDISIIINATRLINFKIKR